MARGSLSKVRWRNDRIRKAKARQRRQKTEGTKLGSRPETQAAPPEPGSTAGSAPAAGTPGGPGASA